MKPYQYKPLLSEDIRLLKLHPGRFSDAIVIELSHETLRPGIEPIPKYEALSYTWGDPEDVQNIQVRDQITKAHNPVRNSVRAFRKLSIRDPFHPNSYDLSVTRSLETALRYLRNKNTSRILWIDAICINQCDSIERGREVLRMGGIYSNAERVVIWLGEDELQTSEIFKFLRYAAENIEVDWDYLRMDFKPNAKDLWDQAEKCFECSYSAARKQGIQELFFRSWFGRLWIWQEVCLANEAVMICGVENIDWSLFRKVVPFIMNKVRRVLSCHPKQNSTYNELYERVSLVEQLASRCADFKVKGIDPDNLLRSTEYALCTDPRDRIYAQISLFPALIRHQIKPDYSQSFSKVYLDAFLKISEHYSTLATMLQCGERPASPYDMGLPTWVPNWSIPRVTEDLEFHYSTDRSSEFRCIDNSVLLVEGVDFTDIRYVSEKLPPKANFSDTVKLWNVWPSDVCKNQRYPDGGSLLEAYCAILTCGHLSDQYPQESKTVWLSLDEAKSLFSIEDQDYQRTISEASKVYRYSKYMRRAARHVSGRRFFITSEGYLGLGSAETKIGDRVCNIPGLPMPMVLRRINDSRDEKLEVIGPSYTHGIMNHEPYLGALPRAWRAEYVIAARYDTTFYVNEVTGFRTQEDPRLWELPSGWESYVNSNGEHRFRNTAAVVDSIGDPRLTPQELKKNGVKIQTLALI